MELDEIRGLRLGTHVLEHLVAGHMERVHELLHGTLFQLSEQRVLLLLEQLHLSHVVREEVKARLHALHHIWIALRAES